MNQKRTLSHIVIIVLILSCLGQIVVVTAQADSPSGESACRSCHEERYYLYDTGKWYCLCGKQRSCTDCHKGNEDTWDVEAAHEEMVANPILEGPEVCQECHPQDVEIYITKFSAVAGIDLQATPQPTQTPYGPISLESGKSEVTPVLQQTTTDLWKIVVFSAFGLASAGLIFFGYRCWKADCLFTGEANSPQL